MSALSLALNHPALSRHPKVLCAASSVSQAWNQAVQQCGACNTEVRLVATTVTASNSKLASFITWLPKHAALIKTLNIQASEDSSKETQQLLQLLLPALQLAGLPSSASPAAGQRLNAIPPAGGEAAAGSLSEAVAADATGSSNGLAFPQQQQQQRQHSPRLCLVSFSSYAPGAAALLAALPAHSLRHIVLRVPFNSYANGPAMFDSLARLKNLQQLQLSCGLGYPWSLQGNSFVGMTSLAQLSQLTELTLSGTWDGAAASSSCASLQQLLAQPLALRVLQLKVVTDLPVLNMARLTQLSWLSIASQLPEGSVLPQQLQHLQLQDCRSSSQLAAVLPIQHLVSLSLHVGFGFEGELLLRLARKSSLKHLALCYHEGPAAAATAPVWAQLPWLRKLSATWLTPPTKEEAATILSGLSAAKSLTELVLEVKALHEVAPELDEDEVAWESEAVAACGSLAKLTGLRHLHIAKGSWLVPGDALSLTALTKLTRLVLHDSADGVTDMAASALACSLKELRHLDLSSTAPGNRGRLGSMVCLAAIAHLSQLTELRLQGLQGLTQQGLMLMIGAPCLQQWALSPNDEVTKELVEAVFAAAWKRRKAAGQGQGLCHCTFDV